MIKIAYLYILPGYKKTETNKVMTQAAEFYFAAVEPGNKAMVLDIAKKLVADHELDLIELCGGLANADLVADLKQALPNNIAIGQVMYGPEYRRPLVDLLKL